MPEAQWWNFHAQATHITQWHSKFRAPYAGANSLASDGESSETTDMTLFVGLRLWHGAELYANPEIDQGFGLSRCRAGGVVCRRSGDVRKLFELLIWGCVSQGTDTASLIGRRLRHGCE